MKGTRYFYWLSLTSLIVAMVTASPLLLNMLYRTFDVDWSLIGQVGETYGAASALLAALAFMGVAISLVIQASQVRTARIQAVRDMQRDLIRLEMDDPSLYGSVLGITGDLSDDDIRQHLYAVLWMNWARLAYEAGVVSEWSLRVELLSDMFKNQSGRDWWAHVGPLWELGASGAGRAEKRFYRIVESEYEKALKVSPTSHSWNDRSNAKRVHLSPRRRGVTPLVSTAVVGVIAGLMLPRVKNLLMRNP
ncbi:DUF6082 family protein [Microbispora sp. KK1-11]|uniref:DUF6082 family protein n=1 Tax=Microbispora sp. KK1-11 TaxID=2053005 RepID=UPI001159409D|nr:DUF6082 family protein [Microbispora sp. KK1-11]TQS30270.1 hypothetical protein FLW16_03025 [Microbispora sp. KK1-11]